MLVVKFKNGYKIFLNLSDRKRGFQITIDDEFGINIPATGELKPNQIEILIDGLIMANALFKKEIIFKNEQ